MVLRYFAVFSISMLSTGGVEFTQQFTAVGCLIEMYPAALVMQASALLGLQSSWIWEV